MSGALVSTLVGLAASNLGIISCESPAYKIVLEFLLPLAVPLLLFRADLRRVIKSTGALLLAFLLGSGNMLVYHVQIVILNSHEHNQLNTIRGIIAFVVKQVIRLFQAYENKRSAILLESMDF